MQQYPHRIETPSGTRYGIPIQVSEDLVTYKMLPLSDAQFEGAVEATSASFDREIAAALVAPPETDEHPEETDDRPPLPESHRERTPKPYPQSIVISERGGLRAIDRQKDRATDQQD